MYGRTGKSKALNRPSQPVPDSRVIPKPRILSALYSYPPFWSPSDERYVVGLDWTMPNGVVAPGQVLPYALLPLFWAGSSSVPMNGSTASYGLIDEARGAASAAVAVTVAVAGARPATSAPDVRAATATARSRPRLGLGGGGAVAVDSRMSGPLGETEAGRS
ncbi:hypothetical protein GA0115255_100145 [Streptomyces sp. Ncost-T6T-2b]|nr:hypothetical protein GA0115255_100145 [Streptomyces sp. Ncost-T6T-2b]